MTLQNLDAILKKATPDVYELAAPEGAASFVVYALSGYRQIRADDIILMEIPQIQIHIVSQSTGADLESRVFRVLRDYHITWMLLDTGYNPDRNWFITRISVVLPDG